MKDARRHTRKPYGKAWMDRRSIRRIGGVTVTVKQAAIRLEVSAATIYALVASGKLRCVRVGVGRGTIRILAEHIDSFLSAAEPARRPQAPALVPRPVRLKHIRPS